MAPRAHAMIAGLLDDVAHGSLRVVIDRRFPLAEAAAAHAYIESRQAFGRVVLVPRAARQSSMSLAGSAKRCSSPMKASGPPAPTSHSQFAAWIWCRLRRPKTMRSHS